MTDDTHQSLEVGDQTVSPGEKTQFRYAVGTTIRSRFRSQSSTVSKRDRQSF
nr:hypothetical protein [Halosolutus halophilus]